MRDKQALAWVVSLLTAPLIWLAFPGGGEFWPLLFVSLVPLFIAIGGMNGKMAFGCAMATGVVHYLLQLYWIVTVLGRYGGLPIWIAVPALVLLASYMALYWGLFGLLGHRMLQAKQPLIALLGLPLLWVGLDWLRATLFTGFPWMDLGYGLAGVPWLIQSADLFGHGGLTAIVVLINGLVSLFLLRRNHLGSLVFSTAVVGLLCILLVGYNHTRWQAVSAAIDEHSDDTPFRVGIVQGNVDQSEKWLPELQEATVSTYLQNSHNLLAQNPAPDLIVWPETALPFYPSRYPDTWKLVGLTDISGSALLTGAPWFERKAQGVEYFNSAQLIAPGKGFTASYAKSHLVPFGEYVPMRNLLPFLAPLVETVGDFTPGEITEPLSFRSGRLGVLICFESIFPDIARKWSGNGANILVNLTNDAWYGKSSAPHHSMAMTIFRAVETRRTIVRSANTGISGFIDPLGRVENPSPIFVVWAKSAATTLMDLQTPFVRWGYRFEPVCLVLALLLLFARGKQNGHQKFTGKVMMSKMK